MGMSIPQLISGTIVVENVFSWPGLGTPGRLGNYTDDNADDTAAKTEKLSLIHI